MLACKEGGCPSTSLKSRESRILGSEKSWTPKAFKSQPRTLRLNKLERFGHKGQGTVLGHCRALLAGGGGHARWGGGVGNILTSQGGPGESKGTLKVEIQGEARK